MLLRIFLFICDLAGSLELGRRSLHVKSKRFRNGAAARVGNMQSRCRFTFARTYGAGKSSVIRFDDGTRIGTLHERLPISRLVQ